MPRTTTSSLINGIEKKWGTLKEKGIELSENVVDKGAEVAHQLEKNPQAKKVMKWAEKNKKEAILGGFMLVGLLISFYWLGSIIVGLGLGLYAPFGIKTLSQRVMNYINEAGPFPSFILGIGVVFMLFHVFSFVVGALIGLSIRSILLDEFSTNTVTTAQHKNTTHKKRI